MSIKIMSQVWELDLPHNAQSIFLALADHADDDGYCYQHDQERRQGPTGGWGHLLPKEAEGDENSYCIEGREGWRTFDANQR